MDIIDREQFKNKKKSDTIVIYGSGWSINDLDRNGLEELSKYDSIGFNWFCKSKIPTTFYLVREQTPSLQNLSFKGESANDFLKDINKYYTRSCFIVIDMKYSSNAWRGNRGWSKKTNRLPGDGVILYEKYYEKYKEKEYDDFILYSKKIDIFNDHVMYATCSISNILHITNWLEYKKFIFVGIDLYDHRYFWLGQDSLRERTRKQKRGLMSPHFTANVTQRMIRAFRENNKDADLYVYNPKSLLSGIIPVWKNK